MKTTYRNILLGIFAAGIGSCMISCSDFLKEDLITSESTQSFETTAGLDKLVIGMYQNLEFHFNYEWAYTLWQYGTDEMAVGNDGAQEPYNSYTSAFDPSRSNGSVNLFDNMYSGIASANRVIMNVPKFYDQNSKSYNTRLGEGYFVRAFNYFRLVSQMGGVPLITEPIESAITDFGRNSAEQVYDQVIKDFKAAYDLLPEKPEAPGRITKWAAAHFLAKASLFRASELNDSWNSEYKNEDLNNVIAYGKVVIENHPLCNDYVELWDFKQPNGANEKVSEVILAAQFSDDISSRGRYGNQVHLYYPSIYQNMPGLKRDISGDREFSRLRPTNYALDVFDRVNDSRFWKSYITTYNCNNPNAAPRFDTVWINKDLNQAYWIPDYGTMYDGIDSKTGKILYKRKFKGGEEAIRYIVNDAGDTRYDKYSIDTLGYHAFVRYYKDEPYSLLANHGNNGHYTTKSRFIALSKFRDGSRPSVAEAAGQRDGILARSAETYLMVAEAYGRQGKYEDALPYINALRKRAGYESGEDRSKHIDGGQAYKNNSNIPVKGDGGSGLKNGYAVYSETNTYYDSNQIDVTTESTKSALVFNSISDVFNSTKEFYTELDATTEAEKFMVFIMNERTRELCGELIRWPDLARSKQLEKRWRIFNDGSLISGADFRADKHYLRPIPQSYLDAITSSGKPLTSEQKANLQNPNW